MNDMFGQVIMRNWRVTTSDRYNVDSVNDSQLDVRDSLVASGVEIDFESSKEARVSISWAYLTCPRNRPVPE